MPPHFYLLDKEAGRIGIAPPKMGLVLEKLILYGYSATRASFNTLGFKTDAPINVVKEAILLASKS
jgi:tRNA G26 N,N-dimethylase Trm1